MIRRSVFLAAMLAALAVVLLSVVAGAGAAQRRVLIYGPSLFGTKESSLEARAAQQLGLAVDVANDSQWASMSTQDFARYAAVIYPDPMCDLGDPSTAIATAKTWGAALTGNVVIHGSDPVYHYYNGDGLPGPKFLLIRDGIAFATRGMTTGAYIDTGCMNPVDAEGLLSGIGAFTVGDNSGNAVTIVKPGGVLTNGLSSASLSNWDSSVHTWYESFPASFQVIATVDINSQEIIGEDYPWMIARTGY